MAAIVITITTTYAQIVDTNGRNGWGTVSVRPSQAFEYTGTASDTFSVTDAAKTVTVEDGVITAVDGVGATELTLSPSDGASNNPVVYYVVDINVNGTTQRKYWVLNYAASTSVAWSSVEQLPSADDPDSAYNQLVKAANPLPQYLLKADTVDAGTVGTASDGRGYVGRLDSSTGKFPTTMIPSGATITGATVSLADAGLYFTTKNAEAALQQIASTSTAFISTARIQNDAVTEAKVSGAVARWVAGAGIDNNAGTLTVDATLTIGRTGNVLIQATQHATQFAVDHDSTGYVDIFYPSDGTDRDDYMIVVTPATGSVALHVLQVTNGWRVRTQNSTSGANTDSDFSFYILKVDGN